ncbi:MAG: hypothetical protein R6U94_14800 [Nitriliruptoraceae bacterium]
MQHVAAVQRPDLTIAGDTGHVHAEVLGDRPGVVVRDPEQRPAAPEAGEQQRTVDRPEVVQPCRSWLI